MTDVSVTTITFPGRADPREKEAAYCRRAKPHGRVACHARLQSFAKGQVAANRGRVAGELGARGIEFRNQ